MRQSSLLIRYLAGFAVGVSALACLAGCGSVRHHSSVRTVVALHRSANPAKFAQAEARALGRRMLSRQALPAGAKALPARQLRKLAQAETIGNGGQVIDLARIYQVPGKPAAVIKFLRRHIPSGTGSSGYSTDGEDGRRVLAFSYVQSSMPDGVSATLFVASVAPASGGHSLLRLDAQVIWCLPRTAAEHVNPAGYRAVSVVLNLTQPSTRKIHKVFTSRAVIAKLASQLNVLHTTGGLTIFCPVALNGFSLRFEPKSHRFPAIVAAVAPCFELKMSVGGSVQPPLAGSTSLTSLVNRLLGVSK